MISPLVPNLLTCIRWILSQILNFHDYNFGGGPPSQLGYALGSLGQSLARVNFSERSPPYRRKYSLPKNAHYGESILTSITFSFVDQSSKFFLAQRGMGRSWSATFSIFDLWIRSGDIRDQIRKLSEIVKKFGRFFLPSQIFGGQAFDKLYPGYNPWLTARRLDKNLWWYPH